MKAAPQKEGSRFSQVSKGTALPLPVRSRKCCFEATTPGFASSGLHGVCLPASTGPIWGWDWFQKDSAGCNTFDQGMAIWSPLALVLLTWLVVASSALGVAEGLAGLHEKFPWQARRGQIPAAQLHGGGGRGIACPASGILNNLERFGSGSRMHRGGTSQGRWLVGKSREAPSGKKAAKAGSLTGLESMLAGAFAGFVARVVVAPIDLAKIRLQVQVGELSDAAHARTHPRTQARIGTRCRGDSRSGKSTWRNRPRHPLTTHWIFPCPEGVKGETCRRGEPEVRQHGANAAHSRQRRGFHSLSTHSNLKTLNPKP
jgi:hypothetical protein